MLFKANSTRTILAIIFMTFATQASAEDKFWVIVWAMNTSDNKNMSGTAKMFDRTVFRSQSDCEQYLMSEMMLKYDGFYAEKDRIEDRLVIRQSQNDVSYFATAYSCDSVN